MNPRSAASRTSTQHRMRRELFRIRRWASPAIASIALAVLIWRLGTGPFVHGLEAVDGRALLAAAAIVFVTTVCSAGRWAIVARGLGVRLSFSDAVAAYYRALFLNLTLPSGVAGDVHRGISHGRDVHDVRRALRAVVWERVAGQVVQVVLAIGVLLVLPSPLRSAMPFVAVAYGVMLAVSLPGAVVLIVGWLPRRWTPAPRSRRRVIFGAEGATDA